MAHDDSKDDTPGGRAASRHRLSLRAATRKQARAAAVIRDNPGLTNDELAALAGCDIRTIQRVKNGKTGSPT